MAGNPGGGLFGSTSGKSLFGAQNTNNSTSNNLFGQPTTSSPATSTPAQGTSLFSNVGNSSGNSFGGGNGSSTGFTFGSKPEADSQAKPATLFGSVGTPSKPDQQAPAQQGGLFGQNTTTPNKPLFNTANTSTTPAGPPPSNAPGGLFGGASGSSGPSLFGNQNRPAEGQNQSSTTNNLFSGQSKPTDGQQQSQGGGLFGAQNKPAEGQSQAPSTSLFGSASGKASPSLFNNNNNNKANSTSLFPSPASATGSTQQNEQSDAAASGGVSSSAGNTTKPTLSFAPASSSGTSTPSLFKPATTSAAPPAPSAPSLFGKPTGGDSGSSTPKSQPLSIGGQQPNTSQTPLQSGNLFTQKPPASSASQQSGAGPAITASTAPPTSANLFSTSKQPTTNETPISSVEGTSKPPATSATAAPSFSLSAAPTSTQAEKTTTTGASTTALPALGSSTNAGGASLLSNSTSGPAPSTKSRLKNKTMDDIITRWSSDLLKYQKDFRSQAEKVAQWDRQLVENTNAISKLYSKTYQAERDTSEIQKQLSAVEGNQDELSQWLDRYEQEVDDMMARQVGQGDGMQGPDQERERTYRTAERVSERLGEMGKDLTSMIEEINTASASINKSAKSDDPLSQIVRVLNGHLAQLQLIDQGTSELQAKITEAQNQSKRLGSRGRSGLGYDAADDFGRTFRSRG